MGFICFRPALARAGFIAAINIDTSFPVFVAFFYRGYQMRFRSRAINKNGVRSDFFYIYIENVDYVR